MKLHNASKLIIAVLACQLAGGIGAVVTAPAITGWYATLKKPALNPPGWVFGPVWITLYFLMGVAAFLIWRKGLDVKGVRAALGIFIIQLVLNSTWSLVFFGLHNPGLALVNIALLWLAIVATIVAFFRLDRRAAYPLIPYLLWVSFASYLNYAIWSLN